MFRVSAFYYYEDGSRLLLWVSDYGRKIDALAYMADCKKKYKDYDFTIERLV